MLHAGEVLLYKCIEPVFVLFTHRDVSVAENNPVSFNRFDLFQINDKGAVYPHKLS